MINKLNCWQQVASIVKGSSSATSRAESEAKEEDNQQAKVARAKKPAAS